MNHHFHSFSLKGLFFVVIAFLAICIASCERDLHYSQMCMFYEESLDLPDATVDSIKSFSSKFGGYVIQHPESKQDFYYEPTVKNIKYAADLNGLGVTDDLTIIITIDPTWEGDTVIHF